MHWVMVGVGPTRNNAGLELVLGIRVQSVCQYRTKSWGPQFCAFSYRWALSSSGAIFPSVTRRTPGPRWSRGPRWSCSSILPLGSLKDIWFDLTQRTRVTVRGSNFQKDFLRWASPMLSFFLAHEVGTGLDIEFWLLLGSCRRGPWWTLLPPSQYLKPGSVVEMTYVGWVRQSVSCKNVLVDPFLLH